MSFPDASQILEKLKVEKFYYDLTWEDLNNKDVIQEFVDKKLIDDKEQEGLMKFTEAYEIKK